MEYITFNDNNKIPALGFGVFQLSKEDCKQCLLEAFRVGYRHIDTAQRYENEKQVGEAIIASKLPRKDLFITSKIWPCNYGYEKAKASIEKSLKDLQLDYIDLMLLHEPYGDVKGAWKALEEAKKEGKIKSIGVSNFNKKDLEKLFTYASITPVVNQIECQPYGQRREFNEYLKKHNIYIESWFPLGHGNKKLLNNETIKEIATKHHVSVPQVILRWHTQMKYIVFPKTLNSKHMQANFDIFSFSLDDEDMKKMASIDKKKSYDTMPRWMARFIYTHQKIK